jgi:phosphatidylglycerophosphatase A
MKKNHDHTVKIHELFLTFFYCGKAKKAPGTVGSFASTIFWFALSYLFYQQQISVNSQNIFWGIFLLAILIYGSIAAPIYTKKLKKIDHPSIVLDETLGQVLALQMSFILFYEQYFSKPLFVAFHLLLSFALFRLFDITKPLFIGYCDRNFKNGFGVMFDDLVAGFFAGMVVILICCLVL